MQLRYSPTSPYVRKVMVTAIECGLEDRIEKIETNVWDPNTDIANDNPLGKVPALITEDGQVLCESPIICDYLDSLSSTGELTPAKGEARWRTLNLAALGQGIMDAAVHRVVEVRVRPEAHRWEGWLDRQKSKISRALDKLETLADQGRLAGVNSGTISLACALAYLDLRFADDKWRQGRPALAGWFEDFSQRPSMKATVPPQG